MQHGAKRACQPVDDPHGLFSSSSQTVYSAAFLQAHSMLHHDKVAGSTFKGSSVPSSPIWRVRRLCLLCIPDVWRSKAHKASDASFLILLT